MNSVEIKYPDNQTFLEHVHLTANQKDLIDTFVKEYDHKDLLTQYALPVSNKLLFYGASGCGKTMTAKAIANQLKKRIIIINLGEIVSSRLGETAKNISALFQKARVSKSILFLDEFDSIATERSSDSNDAGEMRRVVNTLIQLIDNLTNETILIGATNQISLIDHALLRRFEHKLEFQKPNQETLDAYYSTCLKQFPDYCRNLERTYDISFAEAEYLIQHHVKKELIKHHS